MTPKFPLVDNMRQYGGNFVSKLADAMVAADPDNFKILAEAFPQIVEKYTEPEVASEEDCIREQLDKIQCFFDETFARVMAQREEILTAFIAKHGVEPHEIEQVEQRREDGSLCWFVRLVETERADTRRLRYLMTSGPDGFEHLESNLYYSAMERAEQAGRDEPNEIDELNGFRLLIDAAIAADIEE